VSLKSLYSIGVQRHKRVMKRSVESVSEVSIQYRSSETQACYETVGGKECL